MQLALLFTRYTQKHLSRNSDITIIEPFPVFLLLVCIAIRCILYIAVIQAALPAPPEPSSVSAQSFSLVCIAICCIFYLTVFQAALPAPP